MKHGIWIGMTIGSAVGGMIPSLWGSSMFSFSSLMFGALGSVAGIFAAFYLSQE